MRHCWVRSGAEEISPVSRALQKFTWSDLVSKNIFSCADAGRKRPDESGIAFGLPQMISERTHQPASCSAIASRFGIIQRSLGFNVPPTVENGLSRKVRSSPPCSLVAAALRPLGEV